MRFGTRTKRSFARLSGATWRCCCVAAGRARRSRWSFRRAGVPLAAARDGFFESLEVSDLLSLLKLLDNPLQDVPLLAVLRSPLVGMSLDELAEIRAPLGQAI